MRQLRILVADDEVSVRQELARLAHGLGHQLDSVEDGRACVAKLQQNRYDLLFLDLIMPVMDGTQVLEYVREHLPAMRVVIISSLDERSIIDQFLSMGASAYLVKPLRESYLCDVIGRISSGTISQNLTPTPKP